MNAVNNIESGQLQLPLVFSQICPQQQKDAIKADLKKREAEKYLSRTQTITKEEMH